MVGEEGIALERGRLSSKPLERAFPHLETTEAASRNKVDLQRNERMSRFNDLTSNYEK